MKFTEVYLVRHGKNDHLSDSLTADGEEQSRRAADTLISHGLGKGALVLSSDLPRTLQTADIIANAIEATVVPSKRINLGGNDPEAIKDLSDWIDKALSETDIDTDAFNDLVLVTHQPLIHTVIHGSRSTPESGSVANGEVIKFELSEFKNRNYYPAAGEGIEEMIRPSS